jgi:pyruvate,water dikinase
LKKRHEEDFEHYSEEQKLKKLEQPSFFPEIPSQIENLPIPELEDPKIRKRQVTGQPAGPGYITGIARLIDGGNDIFSLQKGEIIVCDAIGPEMTFAVPIAGGIIERRGGMLIHGAIIAREYGIPCVTGVADAMKIIKNGDKVSIDGYLGIVAILRVS